MRAVVTVVAKDRVGIIADVCALLAKHGVNILDISQTVLDQYFTMIMLVDIQYCSISFDLLIKELEAEGQGKELSIRIQREDIFNAMHRI